MSGNKTKRALIAIVAVGSLGWSLWILSFTVLALLKSGSNGLHLVGSVEWFRFFLRRAMAIVMIWLSVRGFRLAAGIDSLEQSRLKVWRVFVGVLILVSSLTVTLVPSTRTFQPDNGPQTPGTYFGGILMVCFAAWFIRSAFPGKRQPLNEGVEAAAIMTSTPDVSRQS